GEYAPEWKEPTPPVTTDSDSKKDSDQKKALLAAIKRLAKKGRQNAAALKMSEDEEIAFRMELQQAFETTWTETDPTPEPPHGRDGQHPSVPPEIRMSDTTKSAAAGSGFVRTELSYQNHPEPSKTPVKTPNVSGADAPQVDVFEDAAFRTVEAFRAVGATRFKIVFLGEVPVGGQAALVASEDVTAAELGGKIVSYIHRSEREKVSVCLRPRDGCLIQIDDCAREVMERFKPFAFLTIETSPGNFQVWLALSPGMSNDERLAVRERLLRRFKEAGETANGGAYNSVRLPGCSNVKEKYRRGDGTYPRVRLISANPGRIVSPLELEHAGLLALPEQPKPKITPVYDKSKMPKEWPDFNEYLQRHWKESEGRPDRSSGEMAWACAALGMGWPRYAVVAELERLSLKKAGRRDNYVENTVANAEAFIARHRRTPASGGRVRMVI
ncbi:MAG: RepB family DNA primase, partial [Acidobacteriota bacterium]|nr:RepB family DNA primase [Acidobacteriota bacterium]